jgi:hydroxymethylpyrimidine pyrophosphatase-like HAD family hydrolase
MANSGGAGPRTLLVSDLDGTRLRPDATLGPATLEVVNHFIDSGGLFTYATARSFTSASRVTHGLQLALPMVTYGGAVIVDPRAGIALTPAFLPASATAQIQRPSRHRFSPLCS